MTGETPRSALGGFAAAWLTVLIWASYPVATRAGLQASVPPEDMVVLRFGLGMLFFLPYLFLRYREFDAATLRRGIPLALCQGAGMAGLAIFGLQYAPASHNAALGPGASPAWVAVLGFLFFSIRPSPRHVLGAVVTFCGVLALVLPGTEWNRGVALGDCMFVAASALGALYVLQLKILRINPWQGAVMVTVYSSIVVVPWALATRPGSLASLFAPGMLWQVVWQGVLIGFVSLLTMNLAIARLGSQRASALFAFVPPLSALLAYLVLGEVPTRGEMLAILAISAGVVLAVSRTDPARAVSFAQAGMPAASKAEANPSAWGLSRPG